jgi:hypothetical protein
VIWYHSERKERIAALPIQASEVVLLGWWLYSLQVMDTTLLTEMIGRMT